MDLICIEIEIFKNKGNELARPVMGTIFLVMLYCCAVLLCCIVMLYCYAVLLCCIVMLYCCAVLLCCIVVLYCYAVCCAVLLCCIVVLYCIGFEVPSHVSGLRYACLCVFDLLILYLLHVFARHVPNHASKEVVVVIGSLTSCDPGNIFNTIQVSRQWPVSQCL